MNFRVSKNKWIVLISIVLFIAVSLAGLSYKRTLDQGHQKSAETYLAQNKLKKAEIEFKNVLQKDPANEYAYLRLSEIYRRLKEPGNEQMALLKAVAINPDNLDAQHRLAQVYLLGGRLQKAREIASLMLEKDPENVLAMHLLALVLVRERNVTGAVKTLEEAIEIAPENPNLYAFLGYLSYYGKKDLKKSEQAYLKAISLNSSFSKPYEELSRIYAMERLTDKLEKLLIDWTKTPGNLLQKFVLLAQFYESQKDLEKAEAAYSKLIGDSEQKDPALQHMLARFYARTGQFSKAALFYNQVLATAENLDVQSELANVYLGMKAYEDAQAQVSDILKKDPNHARTLLIDCQLLIAKSSYNDALERLDQLISIDRTISKAYYMKAVCLVQEDLKPLPGQKIQMAAGGDFSAETWKLKQAIAALKTAVDLSPNYFIARIMLADLYVKTNDLIQAENQVGYVLDRVPDNMAALLISGNLKLQTRDWDGAKKIFLHLVETHPGSSLAYEKLGVIFDAMKKPDEAVAAFKKALDLDPLNMNALNHLVSLYMKTKSKESALQVLNTHLSHPGITEKEKGFIGFLLGKIALSEGKVDPAKKLFNDSINTFGQTTPSLEALAAIAAKEGNLSQAIRYYELILSYDPKFFPARISLSRIFQKQGNIPKARKTLEAILTLQDNYAPAANDLAYLLAEQGQDLEKALRLAKIAESQNPEHPNYLDTLGWVYYHQHEYDLAVYALKKSLEGNPDNAETNYHLGMAYFRLEQFEQGRRHLELALKINPDFAGSEKAREMLGE